jgi:hypothetical protein
MSKGATQIALAAAVAVIIYLIVNRKECVSSAVSYGGGTDDNGNPL